jgi:hypothetical protein
LKARLCRRVKNISHTLKKYHYINSRILITDSNVNKNYTLQGEGLYA